MVMVMVMVMVRVRVTVTVMVRVRVTVTVMVRVRVTVMVRVRVRVMVTVMVRVRVRVRVTMKYPDKYRQTSGLFSTNKGEEKGLFFYPTRKGAPLKIVASPPDGEWQHVSVSLPNRTPSWKEMCIIKDLFWDKDETVVQFHPPEKEYINNHPFCLHLWKHSLGHVTPPSILTGLN